MASSEGRNLIVNYLPSSLTPADFKNMFTPFGEIESCKIVLDKASGQSQGYGFVKFTTDDAATQAIQLMNGRVVDNKTLKVSLARAATPQVQQANLYVANLPKYYTKTELEEMFQPYGQLIEAKILLDPATGVSKGVGFVRFAIRENAQMAIEALHNQIPLGADGPIVVRLSDKEVRKSTTPSHVRGQFRYNPMAAAAPAAYGVSNVTVPGMPQYSMYQMPQGIYDTQADASGFGMYQTATAVPVAAPHATPIAYCLFVYNLPSDADEGLMYRLFGPFGAISNVQVMREAGTQRCKGFGFVHYLKLEDAQQAIISMNGYQLGDKFMQVSFKKQK